MDDAALDATTLEVTTWRTYRKTAFVKAVRMPVSFKVTTLEGTMEGDAGDYLCEGVAGERWPIRHDIFEATYTPVKES